MERESNHDRVGRISAVSILGSAAFFRSLSYPLLRPYTLVTLFYFNGPPPLAATSRIIKFRLPMVMVDNRRPSVAFLTALDDHKGSVDTGVDSLSTTSTRQGAPGCSESGSNSNSRVDSLSRDSRRGRDVKSAEVDLVRYQPLPGSVKLGIVTEKVLFRRTGHMLRRSKGTSAREDIILLFGVDDEDILSSNSYFS